MNRVLPALAFCAGCAALSPPPDALARGEALRRSVEIATRYDERRPDTLAHTLPRHQLAQGAVFHFTDTDPWGRTYRLELVDGRYAVRSAGADGEYDTEDDVVATSKSPPVPFARP